MSYQDLEPYASAEAHLLVLCRPMRPRKKMMRWLMGSQWRLSRLRQQQGRELSSLNRQTPPPLAGRRDR